MSTAVTLLVRVECKTLGATRAFLIATIALFLTSLGGLALQTFRKKVQLPATVASASEDRLSGLKWASRKQALAGMMEAYDLFSDLCSFAVFVARPSQMMVVVIAYSCILGISIVLSFDTIYARFRKYDDIRRGTSEGASRRVVSRGRSVAPQSLEGDSSLDRTKTGVAGEESAEDGKLEEYAEIEETIAFDKKILRLMFIEDIPSLLLNSYLLLLPFASSAFSRPTLFQATVSLMSIVVSVASIGFKLHKVAAIRNGRMKQREILRELSVDSATDKERCEIEQNVNEAHSKLVKRRRSSLTSRRRSTNSIQRVSSTMERGSEPRLSVLDEGCS
jgi:hypothetical protein